MTYHFNDKIVYGLMGKQRSGKDTFADILVDEFDFVKIAFADKLKEVAKDLFNMQGKDRGLLIQLGTRLREIDRNVWLRYVLKQIEVSDKKRFVIPDVRFQNEWETITNAGGRLIRIDAKVGVRACREGYNGQFENDPTEEMIYEVTPAFVFKNNGSLTEFERTVTSFGKFIVEGWD